MERVVLVSFRRYPKYCERRIAITKNNISVVMQTEDYLENMDYLIEKAFQIFKDEEMK